MSQKTLPGLKAKSPIRRRDQIICKTKSLTIAQGVEYHPSIDLKTFESHCDCPASVFNPSKVCKHRIKAALSLIRRGELDLVWLQRAGKTLCHHCGQAENLYPVVHDDGSPMQGVFICGACVQATQHNALAPQEHDDTEVGFRPTVYEEMRRYLQGRINQGEYVHGRDWDTYQLIEPYELQGAL